MQMPFAQRSAEQRPDDKADAEHRAHQAETPRALAGGGNIGDVSGGDRHVGAGDARQQPPQIEPASVGANAISR